MQAVIAAEAPALAFRNLTLGYNRRPAVHHLDLEIPRGALTALVGPNGGGKSTLMKAVAGGLKPLQGRVEAPAKARIAYLPQAAELDRGFPIALYDLVAMGLWREIGAFGGLGRSHKARVDAAIDAVGLAGFEDREIGALSGGQAQRALFARLLLQDAELILLDEPFTAIDAKTEADLLALVRGWRGEGRTVLAAVHDLDMARTAFGDCVLLARELIAHGPARSVLTPENLARAHAMAEAGARDAPVCTRAA